MGLCQLCKHREHRTISRLVRLGGPKYALGMAVIEGIEDAAHDRLFDAEFLTPDPSPLCPVIVEDDDSDIGDRFDGRDHNDQEQWR